MLNEELIRIRRALYNDLGVPFPGIHLRFNQAMPDNAYRILLQEIPVADGKLESGKVLVRETEENLDVLEVEYQVDTQFLPDLPAIWVLEKDIPRVCSRLSRFWQRE